MSKINSSKAERTAVMPKHLLPVFLIFCLAFLAVAWFTVCAINRYNAAKVEEYMESHEAKIMDLIESHSVSVYEDTPYASCDEIDHSCFVFNSKNGDEMALQDFPFNAPGWLITYEKNGNNLQFAYNWEDQTAKYRMSHFGEYYEWQDLATYEGNPIEVSAVPLSGCDLNNLVYQNKFYLLIDSEKYENMPSDSLKAGFLQVQNVGNWTLQTFYHLTDSRIWKRTLVNNTVREPGWVMCGSSDTYEWQDSTTDEGNPIEVSAVPLSGCDLNNLVYQNKFYLLIDSEKYENMPSDSLKAGFLQVQNVGDWTLQTFYHLTDSQIWKRTLVGNTVRGPGWVMCGSSDTIYDTVQNINRDSIYNTYIFPSMSAFSIDSNGCLQAVDDESTPEDKATDMTGAIMLMLESTGHCKLGAGTYYVSGNIDLPSGSSLEGCGNNTIIRLLPSSASGYVIRILQNNTVRGIRFSGGKSAPKGVLSDATNFGSQNGIVFTGNADGKDETRPVALTNIVTDCWFENFDGSGFYGYNTGGGMQNTVNLTDCFFDHCRIGINIDFFMEYSKVNNCIITNCYYACINNGGNNVFTNCTFHGVVGWMCDNSADDKRNNLHGSCIGCTFNHINNMNRPDILGRGYAVIILNSNNGFVFTGCQFWYGNVLIDNSRAIAFSDCLFGNQDPVITVSGNDWGAFFHDVTFFNEPILNVNEKTIFVNCFASDGTRIVSTGKSSKSK